MTLPQSASPVAATPTGALTVHHTDYGCLKATGEDALDLLNRLSTNKVDHLEPGHWAPTVLTSDRGRIVDLLCVVRAGDHVLLLTSPGQQQPVIEWLDKYTIMEDLEVEDVSRSTAVVALAGAGADAALGLAGDEPEYLPGRIYPATTISVGGSVAIAVSRPLGNLPCRLLIAPADAAEAVTGALAEAGAMTADADEWEILRVLSGNPAFGSEMGEPYNPLEAGLIGAIDFTKGCYIGQEVIARLDSYDRVQKYLAVLRFSERRRYNHRRIAGPRRQDGGHGDLAVPDTGRRAARPGLCPHRCRRAGPGPGATGPVIGHGHRRGHPKAVRPGAGLQLGARNVNRQRNAPLQPDYQGV